MESNLLLSLLLYGHLYINYCEVLLVSLREGSRARLHCGGLTEGKVTWSRDTNGQRVDILTTHNGETTKHISDPDRRYGSGADLVLYVSRVSRSDAGRYYCSGTTVELTVISKSDFVVTERPSTLTTVKEDSGDFVVTERPSTLTTVKEDSVGVSVVKTVLMYSGVGLAALVFLLTSVTAETLRVSQTKGNMATLHCGKLTTGSVTWSRDTNGQRVDILTTHNGKTTKLISDPDRRYGSGADLVLTIRRVSPLDAGRYYCTRAMVELSVVSRENVAVSPQPPPTSSRKEEDTDVLHVSRQKGNTVILYCGGLTIGTVTWSRDINGQRVDILTTRNGETTKYISDPDRRYNSGANLALSIYRVSPSDAGRYYCSGTAVELSVKSDNEAVTPGPSLTFTVKEEDAGDVSVVETVLMFGGVGLAFLMFVLVTVAAGRVILHQARQTDQTAEKGAIQLS